MRIPLSVRATPRIREIVTPEGVPLRFEIAPAVERAGAFLTDLFVLILAVVLLAVLLALLDVSLRGSPVTASLLFIGVFLLRHGYFVWFEIRRRGTTPGKRSHGLRVVDRRGGPLTAEAVLARNLTREVEVFLPAIFLLAPQALFPDAPGWARGLAGGWLVVLALMPLFNRDRMRVGDMVAGTLVVRAPQSVLLQDLSARPAARAAAREVAFTREQLGIYGIYELQTLEEILRTPSPDPQGLRVIRDRILRKIRWEGEPPEMPARAFLQAFYDAQRAHLEGRLLMGDRKERKSEVRPGRRAR